MIRQGFSGEKCSLGTTFLKLGTNLSRILYFPAKLLDVLLHIYLVFLFLHQHKIVPKKIPNFLLPAKGSFISKLWGFWQSYDFHQISERSEAYIICMMKTSRSSTGPRLYSSYSKACTWACTNNDNHTACRQKWCERSAPAFFKHILLKQCESGMKFDITKQFILNSNVWQDES